MSTRAASGSPTFPVSVEDVAATLVNLFRHQQKSEIADVLEVAAKTLEAVDYDNWNGGTWTWALRLDIPVALFARIEPRLDQIEEEIKAKLKYIDRPYPNDSLSYLTINPVAKVDGASSDRPAPADHDVHRLWPRELLRLFVSHVAAHKVAVSALKEELEHLGIAAFVAHVNIEPNREWRKEIELALNSAHALAALLTPDFYGSSWTEQEIGWAFGRGMPVIPVRLGTDPRGFAAHIQAVSGALNKPWTLAMSIFDALFRHPATRDELRQAMVIAVRDAASYEAARALKAAISSVDDFSDEQKAILRDACVSNVNVREGFGVTDAIYGKVGHPPAARKASVVADDDIPF